MKKYDLSKIMRRAWELVKAFGITVSAGLKKAWQEAKNLKDNIVETLKANLEKMMYADYHIHAGAERKVSAKLWEKNGNKRMYLAINCYSLMGHRKGQYKAGYVDMLTNQYVVGGYDDVNAETMEYIGR